MKYYIVFNATKSSGGYASTSIHTGSFFAEANALTEETIERWHAHVASSLDTMKASVVFLLIKELDEPVQSEEKTFTTPIDTRSPGIIRRIDELGRIMIPKAVRDALEWDISTPLEIFYSTKDKTFTLKKYETETSSNQH